jgi:IS66 Orf2 like protein.
MLNDAKGFSWIIIACGRTDLRRGIVELAAIVQEQFQMNPGEKNVLFLFWGTKPDRIKASSTLYGSQPVLRAAEQPVGHGLPGKHNALPVPFLLLPVQRGAHHEFLHGDVGDCFHRRIAAGDQHRLLRCLLAWRGYVVCFAVPAAIGIVDIPMQDDLGRYDLKRLLDFGLNGLHGLAALRAEAVSLRKNVFDFNDLRVFRENVPCAARLLLPDMRTYLHGNLFRGSLLPIGIIDDSTLCAVSEFLLFLNVINSHVILDITH